MTGTITGLEQGIEPFPVLLAKERFTTQPSLIPELADPAANEPRRVERFYFKPTKTEQMLSTTIPFLQSAQKPSNVEQTLLLNKLQLKSNILTLRLFCLDLYEGASHTYQEH